MSEKANAVLTAPDAAAFAADWEKLLHNAPTIQDSIEIPRSHLLTEAVALLTRHGWDVKVAMSQNAQLEKRQPMRPAVGAAVICIFSVMGMLVVMQQIANARRERIHLHVRDGDQLQVLHAGRNLIITDPHELEQIVARSTTGMTYPLAMLIGAASLVFWCVFFFTR